MITFVYIWSKVP